MRLSLCLICATAALAPGAGSRRDALARVTRAQYRMGTILEIDAAGDGRADLGALETAVGRALESVGSVEARLSNWRADSELSLVNHEAGKRPFLLSPATAWSLERAFSLAEETDGAFDPTVGAVTRALGLTGEPPRPDAAPLLLETVGWSKVLLDTRSRTIRLAAGAAIDSGAFGKGEALDRAVALLRSSGAVAAARLNFGGQIALLGAAAREARALSFDRVAVALPDDSGTIACSFLAPEGSVSTSGDAEKPGHIRDPLTGRAASFHGSVTVVADTAFRADALSTALFVMGPDKGLAFADREGIAALYVSRAPGGSAIAASRAFPRLSERAF